MQSNSAYRRKWVQIRDTPSLCSVSQLLLINNCIHKLKKENWFNQSQEELITQSPSREWSSQNATEIPDVKITILDSFKSWAEQALVS